MKHLAYIPFVLPFALVISCANNDDPAPDELVGTWESVEAIGNSQFYQSLVFTFKADNSYEALRLTGEQDTGEITGFMYRERGIYTLDESTLRLVSSDISVHTGSAFSVPSPDHLVATGDTRDERIEFSIDNDRTELTLDYPGCGPADNCIDKHTFVKGRVF